MVIINKVLDGADVIAEFLGERERGTYEPRDALPQRAVKPLDMIGLAGQLGDGTVLGGGDDPFRGRVFEVR